MKRYRTPNGIERTQCRATRLSGTAQEVTEGLKELAEQTNANELFLHCSSYGVSERIAALEIIAEDWGLNAEQRPKAVLG